MRITRHIFAIALFVCATVFYAGAQRVNDGYIAVTCPDIPQSINFCGDKVDFDRIDMAERLDRELTGTIYGQTMSSLIIKRANRYFPRLIEILKQKML